MIKLKKNANLLNSFVAKHSRHSFKVDIIANSTTISIFSSFTLKLSEILSSLNLTNQLILIDRILTENQRFRSFSSVFLITAFSTNFNFTSYQHAAVKVFDESQSTFQFAVTKSISNFISKASFSFFEQFRNHST